MFRGALDVCATTSNEEMKIAAARAIDELERQQVPEEVASAYGSAHSFGPEYIIPAPFDRRLMAHIPAAVAQAATESGVAQTPTEAIAAERQPTQSRATPPTSDLILASADAKP